MSDVVQSPLFVSPIETYVTAILQQTPNRLDPTQRHERVVAAAIRACALDGPFDFKMASIADVASVSTATIYREFENSAAVLQMATLRAIAILSDEWATFGHDYLTDHLTVQARIKSFLIRFGETYRHPYSGWLLRADLAIAANNDDQVTSALLAFQNQIVAIGMSCLPRDAFSFDSQYDLIHVLLGAIQLPIINAILAAPVDVSEALLAQTVDLDQKIGSTLAWLNITEPKPASPISAAGDNEVARDKADHMRTPMPKSAMQLHCEHVLSRPAKRIDHKSRRAKILAATMTDCAAVGLEGTSINRIAAIAHVSTASIYREFADKDALIQASIANSIPIYAQATMLALNEADPKIRIAKMLSAQALTLTDPFGAWLFRHYTKLEASNNPVIKQKAQAARAQSVAFWNRQFMRLVEEGFLSLTDLDLTRDIVFGGIHRRSVLARLLQNDDAMVWREIEGSVSAATDMLFRIYGAAVAVVLKTETRTPLGEFA